MAFILHISNNMHQLIEKELVPLLDNGLEDPLKSEKIIIQSQGTSDFLKKKLTALRGITCNLDLPFMNNFVNETLQENLSNPPNIDIFQPEIMSWEIYSILESIEDDYNVLRDYIRGENKALKRFQLSEKIATVFDNYQIYRPLLPLKWERGEITNSQKWQAEIWQKLCEDHISRVQGFYDFITKEDMNFNFDNEQISIFGITTLAPLYLKFFEKMSRYIDVYFFHISYRRSRYGPKDINLKTNLHNFYKSIASHKIKSDGDNEFYASNGTTGLEFEFLLENIAEQCKRQFTEIQSNTLLHEIQKSILHDKQKIELRRDSSLQIHRTHNKMREVEALYNYLLNIIDNDHSIRPQDITVIIPEIEEYIPYFKAVFNRLDEKNEKYLPYRIAEISGTSFEKLLDTFIKILNINNSRFKASYILEILEDRMVSEAFNLSDDDLELISVWIQETGIRWGLDAKYHKLYGHSEFSENSWKFGLNRLLLGYAMNNISNNLYKDIVPYDKIEGQNSEVLGNLNSFIKELRDLEEKFRNKYSLQDWQNIILEMIDNFFLSNNQTYDYIFQLKNSIVDLFNKISTSQSSAEVGIDTIRYYLKNNVKSQSPSRGYFRGEITIGSTQHLNGISSKVICMLGLNEGDFPRIERSLSFDLNNAEDWPGDRSKKNEDRYLFLQSIMAAEKYFYASYIGYDRNNEDLPPSLVLSDLLDFLEDSAKSEDEYTALLEEIYKEHKLKSYSPKYFIKNSSLNSYFEDDLAAAKILQKPVKIDRFYQKKDELPVVEENLKSEITIEKLDEFFSNPARFFTNQRLGFQYPSHSNQERKDLEPVELDNLESYQLDASIVQGIIEGKPANLQYIIMKSEGKLPIKNRSEVVFNNHYTNINYILREEYKRFDKTPLEYLNQAEKKYIRLSMDSRTIQGNLNNVYDEGTNLYFRPARFRGKDAIIMWLHHLILTNAEEQA
ncbi:MAG: exodeoxyribonuclease V subunit gamma, partial [Candidatus Marinimicrobia bacterium]|nr:exodeoxyribonuclease V subunit gamma [Candidatus Neomarinimicrobiota bacterium]